MQTKAIVFRIGSSFYGLDIMRIDEVTGYQEPLKLPGTPPFIEGVLYDRDLGIISIIDFRKRLENSVFEITLDTRIIVVRFGEQRVGLIVDETSNLLSYSSEDVMEKPDFVTSVKNDFIHGFVHWKDRTVTLLDIDAVLSTRESLLIGEFHQTLEQQRESMV